MNITNKFIIRERESGNFIADCKSLEMAEKLLTLFEVIDKRDDVYVEDFYEIYNTETEEVEA